MDMESNIEVLEADTYLGDGAYARLNDFGELVIYTHNGIFSTNSVYLERPSIAKLLKFIAEASK